MRLASTLPAKAFSDWRVSRPKGRPGRRTSGPNYSDGRMAGSLPEPEIPVMRRVPRWKVA
jgi:hypothetical protein